MLEGFSTLKHTVAYPLLMSNQKQDYSPTEPGYKAVSIGNMATVLVENPICLRK